MIFVTTHAKEQGFMRCGITPSYLVAEIEKALDSGRFYEHSSTERWVAIDGYKGPGTAIMKYQAGMWDVITVRDAGVFTQAERSREKLTAKLLEVAGRKPEVTYTLRQGVLVHIEGSKKLALVNKEVFDDGGLIQRLLNWCWKEGIRPIPGSHGVSGGGMYSQVHTIEDAERIKEWLSTNEAKEK